MGLGWYSWIIPGLPVPQDCCTVLSPSFLLFLCLGMNLGLGAYFWILERWTVKEDILYKKCSSEFKLLLLNVSFVLQIFRFLFLSFCWLATKGWAWQSLHKPVLSTVRRFCQLVGSARSPSCQKGYCRIGLGQKFPITSHCPTVLSDSSPHHQPRGLWFLPIRKEIHFFSFFFRLVLKVGRFQSCHCRCLLWQVSLNGWAAASDHRLRLIGRCFLPVWSGKQSQTGLNFCKTYFVSLLEQKNRMIV